MGAAVPRLTKEINSAIEKTFQFKPFLHQSSSVLDNIFLGIIKITRIRNRWHRSRYLAPETEVNHPQRSIKLALFDVEYSCFNAEAQAHPRNAWKVIRSIQDKKKPSPSLEFSGILRTTDSKRAENFAD